MGVSECRWGGADESVKLEVLSDLEQEKMKGLKMARAGFGYASAGEDLGKGRKAPKGPGDWKCTLVYPRSLHPPSVVRRESSTQVARAGSLLEASAGRI